MIAAIVAFAIWIVCGLLFAALIGFDDASQKKDEE